MNTDDISALTDAMMRHHGKTRALKLADRYASEAMMKGDARGHSKWSAVAARIAESIELEERFSGSAD